MGLSVSIGAAFIFTANTSFNNMHTYIALLRGINVGAHNRIKMDDLKALAKSLNCTHCTTYIQSGNLVFKSHEKNKPQLEKMWHTAIQHQFQFHVPVIIKSIQEWQEMIQLNPFTHTEKYSPDNLHVTFLSQIPDKTNVPALPESPLNNDDYSLINSNVYLHCVNPYHKSKLSNSFFEKKLKLNATTRNWKTILELMSMANSLAS